MGLRCRYLCVSGSLAIVLGGCIMHFVSGKGIRFIVFVLVGEDGVFL